MRFLEAFGLCVSSCYDFFFPEFSSCSFSRSFILSFFRSLGTLIDKPSVCFRSMLLNKSTFTWVLISSIIFCSTFMRSLHGGIANFIQSN